MSSSLEGGCEKKLLPWKSTVLCLVLERGQ
jgi:hypothetical protein